VTRFVLSGLLAVVLPGTVAQANEVTLSFGAAFVSEYISDGIRYSDGVAFQPYAEVGFGGAYAGAYTTNVDADLTGADRETGLSVGYRGEAGSFSYDVSVNYYMYDEAFDDFPVEDYAETIANGTFAVSEQMQTELQVVDVQLHDVTGDGVLDAVANAITTGANTLLASVADPAQLTFEPMDEQAQLLDVIDLDGTGTPTLVFVSNDGIELQTTLDDGSIQGESFVAMNYSRGLVVSGTGAELSLAMVVSESCALPCTDACEVACFFDACIPGAP